MAEPIGLASGLLAVASFAFQSSIALYKTIQSFQNHPKIVRNLEEELAALSGVLDSLIETVKATTGVDLSALDFPLQRCGNACKVFEQEILKCLSRSGGGRRSFRDWSKLQYMGDDIAAFGLLLAGYKSTIIIALTDVNLRKSSVTAESLEVYKNLIKTTTDDLEDHLRNIDQKLETIFERTVTESASDLTELRLIKDERMSAQKCLQICTQLSNHISQIQLDPETLPERLTSEGLQECKNSIILTVSRLERFMKDRIDRLVTKSKTVMKSEEDLADLVLLRDEWEMARQCVDICSKADIHLKENISNIENYATGDAVQWMVSTDGTPLHGINRGLGWRTRQVGGHLSNDSVQQISRDMSRTGFENFENEAPSSQSKENMPGSEFKERYGQGFKLSSKTTAHTTTSSTPPAEGKPSGSSDGQGSKPTSETTAHTPTSSTPPAEGRSSSSSNR